MKQHPWQMVRGDGPLVATAIHDGHAVRPEVARRLAVDDDARRREEDPHTAEWTSIAPSRIVVAQSRFEVDMNRPRDKAVYRGAEDAWGLDVWREPPGPELVSRSLTLYDAFYTEIKSFFGMLTEQHARVVVFDLHSYNHRRAGADAAVDDPALRPEINIGTKTMDRRRWTRLVDALLDTLTGHDFLGRRLEVRENVPFGGGWFPQWLHQTFPERVCVISIEVKKFFMDEWSGLVDRHTMDAVYGALRAGAGRIERELGRP